MIDVYLFDWGDTLMVDFPDASGKMCNWDVVEAVAGAQKVLMHLSKKAQVFVATGAADSTEKEIEEAFKRVGLSQYITGYFCQANLGVSKGSTDFFPTILSKLNTPAGQVAMVGDSLTRDIEPAASVGIRPVWFSKGIDSHTAPVGTRIIGDLCELCVKIQKGRQT